MALSGIIPTFHIGLRSQITDPDGIVNYVMRHVIMNPGSITSLHSAAELSMKKLEGDYPNVGPDLFEAFRAGLQEIFDRYAISTNKFIVAFETKYNDAGAAIMQLSIKATANNRIISYDRDFLVKATEKFRDTILRANGVQTVEEEESSGQIQNTDMTAAPAQVINYKD